MKPDNKRTETNESGNDKNIDTTRSQNREGVAAAGNDTGDERMGSLSEAGNEHSKAGHTGSHQEGEYDKDHLDNTGERSAQRKGK